MFSRGLLRNLRSVQSVRVPRFNTSISRRHVQTSGGGPFQPLRPPSPGDLGAPRAAKQYPRGRKWTRRIVRVVVVGGVLYLADRQIYSSGGMRSLRTFAAGLVIAIDYKINFRPNPWTGGTIQDLHLRNAQRVYDLIAVNGGLYTKIGQAIAMQSALLPPAFQKMFARMFDDAYQDEWRDVEAVIKEDFGKSVEEVFGVSFTGKEGLGLMEKKARASASVAQVHWAKLPDGREVAIKVQKREIAKQRAWDLWSFKTVTWIYSKWFNLPFDTLVPFITERLDLEMDFENELKNSETMRALLEKESSLRHRVYIPKAYEDMSSKRVLTTEWIEGVRLWDKEAMSARWKGGYGKASPGVGGHLPEFDVDAVRRAVRTQPNVEKLKPERQEWRGPRGTGGLGLSSKEVMTTMVDLFSAQIYSWGVVHCDPHPGNIFIRRLANGHAELVLIDHGLYSYLEPNFRRQYCQLWKALLTFDNKTIQGIANDWGINAAEFLGSATLLRPYEGHKDAETKARESLMSNRERSFQMHQKMMDGVRDMLSNEDKWPKELIFLGRNMRIVQGNNQYLGSPVNRVKMMGQWASRSLYEDRNLPLGRRAENAVRHVLFKFVLAASDVAFYFFKMRQWLGIGGGMEDEMEERMKQMAEEYGVELQSTVFDG